jgi:hypothetical protein
VSDATVPPPPSPRHRSSPDPASTRRPGIQTRSAATSSWWDGTAWTETWEGLAKTMFTTADNYVVQVHRPLADPLRQLVVARALCVDTALKQDQRGFN